MNADPLAFLRDAMDEAEAVAQAIMWDGSGNKLTWELAASATIDVGGDDFGTGDRTIANHVVAHDPATVLRRIAADRKLLADLLAEKHQVVDGDCWYTCTAATEEHDGGENCDDNRHGDPCDCGRDTRVHRRIQILAESYGWTANRLPGGCRAGGASWGAVRTHPGSPS